MHKTVSKAVVFFILCLQVQPVIPQSTTTSLKEEAHIQTFLRVTEKIRCICLPSLPIQSCSFNMCSASAYLKTFIENRIREGMSEEEILQKMENGFGEGILEDSVVKHFRENGNGSIVDSIVFGFGPKILAKPDGTWINLSLMAIALLGLFLIYRYGSKKIRMRETEVTDRIRRKSTTMSTEEIQKKINQLESNDSL
ncbi:MAG: cytochrome c-type biogenesis protein CcmH [Leptospira sp.]|nr:cytochrome c-type biogenesis protein CcmH [Leptospira sp.]